MAVTLTDNGTNKKAKKKIIKKDLYKRVELTGDGTSGLLGEIYYPKATTTLVASDLITITITA